MRGTASEPGSGLTAQQIDLRFSALSNHRCPLACRTAAATVPFNHLVLVIDATGEIVNIGNGASVVVAGELQ